MTSNALRDALRQFTGTDGYFRYNPGMFPNVVLTDGAKFLADEAKAWWLMDAIASHLPSVPADESFIIASLKVENSQGKLVLCQDRDETGFVGVYAEQQIEFTDFPLSEITLYVARGGSHWVVMLTSEY